ncbi:MAG: DUF5655 domain-containing protein [Flammeovirgaceae bacterium]|nr:DUF5655 domain-containing protein [Flammeovirgaceae bacterium]
MLRKLHSPDKAKTLDEFLHGKSPHTLALFHHFINEFKKAAPVTLEPAKTMIGIATKRKRIVYITQLGKSFIHVVFPFERPYTDNLCFQKIAQVPGDVKQFNHHFRMMETEDVNEEVRSFMRMAFKLGS